MARGRAGGFSRPILPLEADYDVSAVQTISHRRVTVDANNNREDTYVSVPMLPDLATPYQGRDTSGQLPVRNQRLCQTTLQG